MSDTFCGKSCQSCTYKENLSCRGCKSNTGDCLVAACTLASCCKNKGYDSCVSCTHYATCASALREGVPQYRLGQPATSAHTKDERTYIVQKAPILGQYLWILFWMFIPNILANLMTNDAFVAPSSSVYMFGQGLSLICSIIYGIILLELSSENDHYRIAGICNLLATPSSILGQALFGELQGAALLLLFISIFTLAASLYGIYHEFIGHTEILAPADYNLSEKWRTLWNWFIICYASIFGSLLLATMSATLGVLTMFASVIGLLVISILRLIYLYYTADLFRSHMPQQNNERNI